MSAKDRIIFALDYRERADAVRAADKMRRAGINHFKIGLTGICAGWGRDLALDLLALGCKVGWDIKLPDTPNTNADAATEISEMGVTWFTVMGNATTAGILAAVLNRKGSDVYVVTALTTMDNEQCVETLGGSIREVVLLRTIYAKKCIAQGVTTSARELTIIHEFEDLAENLNFITPAIRPAWAQANDQKRTMEPGQAIRLGATYLVVGRPISRPPESIGSSERAVALITQEIEEALTKKQVEGR